MPTLKKALSFSRRVAALAILCALAAILVAETGFALQCRLQRHRMANLLLLDQHRRDACLDLKWRWEAGDQELQYKAASSAGSHTTVGPIAGYVMDVTESESGHAEGYCHSARASYQDLVQDLVAGY